MPRYATVPALTREVEDDVVDGDAAAGHLLQEDLLQVLILREDIQRQWLLSARRRTQNRKLHHVTMD